MSDDNSSFLIIFILVMLVFSAFFSASESAYSTLNTIRLKTKAEAGDKKAVRVLSLLDRYDNLLSTILIGNNVVNIAMTAAATVLFTKIAGKGGPALSTLVVTIVVLIFGEISPKSLAKEHSDIFAAFSVDILTFLMKLLTPVNFIFVKLKKLISRLFRSKAADPSGITDAELMTIVDEAEHSGDLTDRESELIRNAIEFDDVEAEEVLTPRPDVVAVSDETGLAEIKNVFIKSGFSRLPVYHGTIDNIIGVVHEKDLFALDSFENKKLDDMLTSPCYVPASTKISVLLKRLREEHNHLAVIVDEYGGTLGIVTLEDLLEELVGEIWDEHDEEIEEIVRQSDNTWLISGNAKIDDMFDALDIPDDPDEIDAVSVNGLVQEQTGRIAKVGDKFVIGRYEGTVINAARRRVTRVLMKPLEHPETGEDDE